MRRHSDPALEAAASQALSDPRTANAETSYELRLNGLPVIPREIRYEAKDVREQNEPAMFLDLILPGSWPDTLEGASAEVDVVIAGTPYAEFRGNVMWIEETGDGDTKVEAYSVSTWLTEQENGKKVSWVGIPPRRAMHDTVSGLKYSRLDLSGVPTAPLLNRDVDDVFEVDEKRSGRLDDLRDQAQITFYDGPDGAGIGATLASLSVPSKPVVSYVVGESALSFTPTPKFKGRFYAVKVRGELPGGGKETIRTIKIDNRGVYVPEDVIYPVDATDTTPEGLSNALNIGIQTARALTYGAWEGELVGLVLDSRIVRGDTVSIEETKLEGEAEVTRRWLMVVAGYGRDPDNYIPTLTGACLKVSEVTG